MAAAGYEGWQKTGAVAFSFRGKHHHLWDRERGFVRVAYGDTVVWLDLASRRGVVKVDGKVPDEPERLAALEQGWSCFCNDTFWLNPLGQAFRRRHPASRGPAARGPAGKSGPPDHLLDSG